jgi:hypothetical protein
MFETPVQESARLNPSASSPNVTFRRDSVEPREFHLRRELALSGPSAAHPGTKIKLRRYSRKGGV